jgi:hypothetical protein
MMSEKSIIWCSHPKHDEVLPNGKKCVWKTGIKPTHPKGKRRINKKLAEFINRSHRDILNGTSKRLMEGDSLCSTCFEAELKRFMSYEEPDTDVKTDEQCDTSDCSGISTNNNSKLTSDNYYNKIEQYDAKLKLNQVFEYLNVEVIHDM